MIPQKLIKLKTKMNLKTKIGQPCTAHQHRCITEQLPVDITTLSSFSHSQT